MLSNSLPAIVNSNIHTLILGSMPGQASLLAAEYYAHSRNAFWPIMFALLHKQAPNPDTVKQYSYPVRCKTLLDHGFGIWDVLAQCERPGSLDSAIVRESEIANDLVDLIDRSTALSVVAFNGRAAEKLFNRHILHLLSAPVPQLVLLPSSSPALASLSLQQKCDRWRLLLQV